VAGQPVTGTISGNVACAIAGGAYGRRGQQRGDGHRRTVAGPASQFLLGSGMADVDLRISREFKFTARLRLSLLGEGFNVFNFTNAYTVNTQQYTHTAAGSGVCAGHTNGRLIEVTSFLTPSAPNHHLFGARQLPISGRITF